MSVGNLKLSSAYNLKSTTVSDTTKATVTASNSAPSGTQSLNIISVAQAGYLTGGQLDSSVSTSTTLAELGYTFSCLFGAHKNTMICCIEVRADTRIF